MALADATARKSAPALTGSAKPRQSPPLPARTGLDEFRAVASGMGIELMPWQETAAKYLTARGPDGLLFREVCVVVARQNGKTTLMKPLIIRALREGKRVMHIAQTRELPREMFGVIADSLDEDEFPKRRGKTIWPRYGAGQEEIILRNGGRYRIAAASRGGARGHPNDLVIIDELREMEDFTVIGAAEPTLTMSSDPQMVYLSNAGDEKSIVLNSVRDRAEGDPNLAYLEWSASPDYLADDRRGWAQANPALGHFPSVARTLEAAHRKHSLAGTLAIFETEHLCRWVKTLRESLVDELAWAACAGPLGTPRRPSLGISVAPDGSRASAALAWRMADDRIALKLIYDVPGSPIDVDALGPDLRRDAGKLGVVDVSYDPHTDAALAKFFKKPESVAGAKFSNATAQFVNIVTAGRLVWADAAAVTDDLTWTARKHDRETGTYEAVRSNDSRPITASLAAIRAVWRALDPKLPQPKVY